MTEFGAHPSIACREFRRGFESAPANAAHAVACAACREWLERRQAVDSALRQLRESRHVAPAALRVRVERAGSPEVFVGSVLRHLDRRPAPAALDAAIQTALLDADGRARIPVAPSERAPGRLLRVGFALARRPAVKIAAIVTIAVGGALGIRHALRASERRALSDFELVRCNPEEIPTAIRSSLESLAGGIGGIRKG
jgi:hypothetical protein